MRFTRILEVLADAELRLRDAASKKILIEVTLLRAIEARNAVSLDAVLKQLNALRGQAGAVRSRPRPQPSPQSAIEPADSPSHESTYAANDVAPAQSASSCRRLHCHTPPRSRKRPPLPADLETLWAQLVGSRRPRQPVHAQLPGQRASGFVREGPVHHRLRSGVRRPNGLGGQRRAITRCCKPSSRNSAIRTRRSNS